MFVALLCISAVVLPLSFGDNTVDTCFKQATPCKIDDSKYPPYNTFTNQLDANACKRACLDQNDKGILVNDGGAKTTKYCQLAVSRQGLCKLYYQTGIDTGAASGSGSANPVAFGPVRTNGQGSSGSAGSNAGGYRAARDVGYGGGSQAAQVPQPNYGNQGGQPNYGNNQGSQGGYGGNQGGWGPSRTQDGNAGGQGGQGGDQCWQLQPGCPGYGGAGGAGGSTTPATGATGSTTASSAANAACFDDNKKDLAVIGSPLVYLTGPSSGANGPVATASPYLGADFTDDSLNGCEGQCLKNANCSAINYFAKSATDPALCVLHSDVCKEGVNCKSTGDEHGDYWRRIGTKGSYAPCPPASG